MDSVIIAGIAVVCLILVCKGPTCKCPSNCRESQEHKTIKSFSLEKKEIVELLRTRYFCSLCGKTTSVFRAERVRRMTTEEYHSFKGLCERTDFKLLCTDNKEKK